MHLPWFLKHQRKATINGKLLVRKLLSIRTMDCRKSLCFFFSFPYAYITLGSLNGTNWVSWIGNISPWNIRNIISHGNIYIYIYLRKNNVVCPQCFWGLWLAFNDWYHSSCSSVEVCYKLIFFVLVDFIFITTIQN